MDALEINGGVPLHGDVTITGAKNAALPLMAASLLTSKTFVLHNLPPLQDIQTMKRLLTHTGAQWQDGRTITIAAETIQNAEAPYDLVKTMRASSLVLGPLLARTGNAHVSLPGGCAIGARPLNLHLKALEAMGAEISIAEGYITARAKKLKGAHIIFDTVTVTGTENIMMAATLADGVTVLENAAQEPEIADLAQCLNKMGAKIEGAGSSRITITGVPALGGVEHTLVGDRIEAGTYLMAAAITGGSVTTIGVPASFLQDTLDKLAEAGCSISSQGDRITLTAPKQLRAVDVTTAPFPGFATDLQAQFMACMTIAQGTCVIRETIFENRFMHVAELSRMGADIKVDGHTAHITGVPHLSGAPVMATDLRASACLVLAGLAAQGTTEIRRIYHLDRGYEHVEDKLQRLGARVSRVKSRS
ncbi:MAG: UDP-N-acetylglucosamine 1-carboxyvinyltransferase [Deltaproteobacteria bacterium CG11_big_fil_rev_8_21_14_0_20_47_16]|nr:MAG: UDP-N-acetylglucosamine 1-carboxyvinyltransferase [Deltaproteobacteria bacterium CG11_big_fil_rev_8_21_14_0_20_47_16]